MPAPGMSVVRFGGPKRPRVLRVMTFGAAAVQVSFYARCTRYGSAEPPPQLICKPDSAPFVQAVAKTYAELDFRAEARPLGSAFSFHHSARRGHTPSRTAGLPP